MAAIDKEIKKVISIYKNPLLKFYICLKYKLTPFKELEKIIKKNSKILDIGCGYGSYDFYLYFKSNERKIIGVDNNKKRLEFAKKISNKNPNLNFEYCDFNKKYDLYRADTYMIFDVLHHIPNKSKIKLLEKVYKKMEKGDILLIKEIYDKEHIKFMINYINDKFMTSFDKLYFIRPNDLFKLLRKIGFNAQIKVIKGYLFPHILFICRK